MLIAALLAAVAAWLASPAVRRLERPSPLGRLHDHWSSRRTRRVPVDAAPALSALAAELASGASLDAALLATTQAPQLWPQAVAAARAGGDVAAGLDADGARALAACWRVAGSSGAGLARAIGSMAEYERSTAVVRARLAAELAAPRASARMLAMLPLVGIAMGIVMGADPVRFLLSGLGLLCLGTAVLLTGLGLLWGARIARGVERLL